MRRPLLVGVIVGLAVVALVDAIGVRAGVVPGLIPRSDGPWLWISSRAAGVVAFLALAVNVAFGLLVSTGAADRWVRRKHSVDIHRWLSAATLALTAVHALLLVGDGFVRFDLIDLLVPFAGPFRPIAVGLGILAGLAAVIVHVSFGLRRHLGATGWRRLHRLSFAALALALLHGLLAGTDSGSTWLRAVYLLTAVLIGGLLLLRLSMPARAAGSAAR